MSSRCQVVFIGDSLIQCMRETEVFITQQTTNIKVAFKSKIFSGLNACTIKPKLVVMDIKCPFS